MLQNAGEVGTDGRYAASRVVAVPAGDGEDRRRDRRRYERIDGHGAAATLRVAGRDAIRATITDISRGGVASGCDWSAPAGTEVQVELPGTVQRCRRGWCAPSEACWCWRSARTQAMLRSIDAALEQIGGEHESGGGMRRQAKS